MKKLVIEEMQRKHDISERAASQAVDQVLGAITGVLEQGEKVTLQGFGSFERKYREARTGRNPRTGEPVTIAARHSIKFRESRRQNR